MNRPVGDFARLPLSFLTRFRLLLFGHEDLASIVFWAALVGICGALASVVFREGIRLLEVLFTGQSISLVHAASSIVWWHRALVPLIGGVLAGLVLHLTRRTRTSARAVDYMEAMLVGDGRISLRATLWSSLSSLLTIASGGSGLSSERGHAAGLGTGRDQSYLKTVADYVLVPKSSAKPVKSPHSSRSGTVSRRHSFGSQGERPSFSSSVRPDSSASRPTRRDGGIIFAEDGRLRFRSEVAREPEEVPKRPLSASLLNLFTQFLVTFSNTSRLFTYAKYGTVRRGSISINSISAIDYDAEDSETDDFFVNSDESFVHLRSTMERRAWFLSAMKWLSFERVLFSPGHHLMVLNNGGTILDLDSGGIGTLPSCRPQFL